MGIVKRCAYGSCNNTSETNADDSVQFVPFPKPITKRTRQKVKRWTDACGEEKSDTLRVKLEQKRQRLYVCSTHFVGKNGPTKFNPDPIQFVPPSPDIDSSSFKVFRKRKICAVPECGSVSTHDELISFHPLPKHHIQLELWRDAIQFDEKTLAKKYLFVCSKHFISGMKSDFPSHPDFIPSIFPSSTSQEIKALRNKLREFETVQTKDVLEKRCASLRQHWFESGFKTKDLNEGMRRVKAEKRQQAFQEKTEYEIKKARLEKEKERERRKRKEIEDSLRVLHDIKHESGSDTVSEDFVIETDRAEEGEEFDLSRVKEEPISDSESPTPVKPQDNQSDICSQEGDNLLLKNDIKQESSDEEYEQSRGPPSGKARDDSCDEMLTVHFGDDDSTDAETESTEAVFEEEPDRRSTGFDRSGTGQQVVQLKVDQYKCVQQAFAHQNYTLDNKSSPQSQVQFLSTLTGHMPSSTSQQTRISSAIGQPKVMDSYQGQNTVPGQNTMINQMQFLPNNMLFPIGQTGNQQILLPNNLVNHLGQPLIPLPIVGIQGGKQNIGGPQQLNIPQIGAQFPFINQIPRCMNPSSVPKPPDGVPSFVPTPLPSSTLPASVAPSVTTTSIQSSSTMKTVVALDPNTYQTPLTNSTTFVVPQENILTLSYGDLNKTTMESTEKPKELKKAIYTEEESVDMAQDERHETDDSFTTEMLNQFNRRASTSSEEMQISSDEDSQKSVHSVGYQPGSSSESSDVSQDEFEELDTKNKKQSHDSSPDIEIINKHKRGGTTKKCDKSTSKLLQDKLNGSNKFKQSHKTQSKEKVSKVCQTDRSISKEAFLEAKLKEIGVQATSKQFKYLLQQPLLANGHCSSFKMTRKLVIDCAVQTDMDKMILPDLAYQCKRLSKDVNDHKTMYHALTYDFLQSGSSKSKVNCHTGCYTLKTLKDLFDYVSISLDSPPLEDLSQFQEFVLTLMKLRLGLQNYDLAFRFEIPPSLVSQILNKWVSVMANTLCQLVEWPLEEPERTEHRNQRWRILKLRYDLLMAYDGIESMKDKWLLEQDLDTIIMICDVLNSFQIKESAKVVTEDEKVEPKPVEYFVEEFVVEDMTDDDCLVTSKPDNCDNVMATKSDEVNDNLDSDNRDIEIITENNGTGSEMLKQIPELPEGPDIEILKEGTGSDSGTAITEEGTGPDDLEEHCNVDPNQDMDLEDEGTEGNIKDSEIIKEGNCSIKEIMQESKKDSKLHGMVDESPSTEEAMDQTEAKDISNIQVDTKGSEGSPDGSKNSFEHGTEGKESPAAQCEVSPTETDEDKSDKSSSSKQRKVYQVIHVDDGDGLMIGPPALELEVVDSEHVPEMDVAANCTYGRFIPSEILNCFE